MSSEREVQRKVAANQEHRRLLEVFREAGYCGLWEKALGNCLLTCWSGPRGTLIAQSWLDCGVEIYGNTGVPHEWSELEKWLGKSPATV